MTGTWAEPFVQNPLTRNLLIPVCVFALFYTLSRLLASVFFALLHKIGGSANLLDGAFRSPLRVLLIGTGLFAALSCSPAVTGADGLHLLTEKCFRSFLIMMLAWGLSRMAGGLQSPSSPAAVRLNLTEDRTVLKAVASAARFLVCALAVLMIAQEWNFSVSGLVTGLGIGGLAFALAAKDMLTNLFGGLVILLDKPFSIGDRIKTGDVEGTVEDINFRSLKIRTESQALVTVPNGMVAAAPVTNYSRMEKRKLAFNVALASGSPEKDVRNGAEKIRQTLRVDKDIEDGTFAVSADMLGAEGPILTVSCYVRATGLAEYLGIKERLSSTVLRILTEEGLK